jgi:hypothetical protein
MKSMLNKTDFNANQMNYSKKVLSRVYGWRGASTLPATVSATTTISTVHFLKFLYNITILYLKYNNA